MRHETKDPLERCSGNSELRAKQTETLNAFDRAVRTENSEIWSHLLIESRERREKGRCPLLWMPERQVPNTAKWIPAEERILSFPAEQSSQAESTENKGPVSIQPKIRRGFDSLRRSSRTDHFAAATVRTWCHGRTPTPTKDSPKRTVSSRCPLP